MTSIATIFRRLALACACLVGWSQATALCVGGGIQNLPRYVGNTDKTSPGYDSKCTDNDIQSAINNTVCPNTPIYITGEHTYTQQALSIQGKWLSLVGSTNACGVPASTYTSPAITISGTPGFGVIAISGSSTVTLQYLTISGGNPGSTQTGGGVYFGGVGSLTLDTDTVTANKAGYGAGVDMSPTGASSLTILSNTLILENTAATSGGGIRIEGATQLVMVSDKTLVAFNTATAGYGGGLEVVGPARADIGSPGLNAAGVISNNTAAYGGGIAVIANQDDGNDAIVQLFTTEAAHPVNLQENSGTIEGGALYIKPFDGAFDNYSYAAVCAYNFRIDGNTAPEGAAVYLDFDTGFQSDNLGGGAVLNTTDPTGLYCGTDKPSDFGAVACAADAPCNELSGNETLDAQLNPNDGAILFAASNAEFDGEGITLHGNQAGHAMRGVGDSSSGGGDAFFSFHASLIADNSFSAEAILGENVVIGLSNCTVAHDDILASHVINIDSGSDLLLHDDIIGENGTLALEQPGGATLDVHYVLSNDISTLPVSANVISQDPMFVSPSLGNYHLQAYLQDGHVTASRAIDFAPLTESNYTDVSYDLEGNPYGQDVPLVPDAYGTRDLGAYEARPITDRIFGDAFGDELSLLR